MWSGLGHGSVIVIFAADGDLVLLNTEAVNSGVSQRRPHILFLGDIDRRRRGSKAVVFLLDITL